MQWRPRWMRWQQAILDFLFPPRCVGCGARDEWFCRQCRASVPRVCPPLCQRCGRPVQKGSLCFLCRAGDLHIDGIRAPLFFEGKLRRAIHDFKYEGTLALAAPLAQILVAYQQQHALPADLIVPVPLHPDREAERGYNQAGLLASALGQALNLPVADAALVRTRPTPPQVGLSASERQVNVAGAFQARKRCVTGRRVLLIDDVCTTGSTLEACSRALKAEGARSVWGLTLARAR